MITLKELIKNIKLESLPKEHQDNIMTLLERINRVRHAWAKPMTVTSGYRSKDDHMRIYKELATKRGHAFDEKKIPWGSNHLKGAAVDIADPDYKLIDWCMKNDKLLEEIGLWCEEKDDVKRVHFQIFPPKSGKRFFKP
jgi:uncharacterized protein YcbK (DUF882 family)